MIDRYDLSKLIRDTLDEMGLYSSSAMNLLLGTAAQESEFGTRLWQINGPALGLYQMEPQSYEDTSRRIVRYPHVAQALQAMLVLNAGAQQLAWNLKLATAMCRAKYYLAPERLPDVGDVGGLATYWKKYWNTASGRGTEEEFVANFKRYVG